jgi:hypothetical protein
MKSVSCDNVDDIAVHSLLYKKLLLLSKLFDISVDQMLSYEEELPK